VSIRPLSTLGIRELAQPYLRGFRPVAQPAGGLRGYWFLRPKTGEVLGQRRFSALAVLPPQAIGFFTGFLLEEVTCPYLQTQPPEAIVFAFVHPVGSPLHQRLVAADDSLFRNTYSYIRWLTHRPPRFELYDAELTALVRHGSMRPWPAQKYMQYSRNFFVETLAWLVRSGLVRRLLRETLESAPVALPQSRLLRAQPAIPPVRKNKGFK
jgi:hypothetical protein